MSKNMEQDDKFDEYAEAFAGRLRKALGTMPQSDLVKLLTEHGLAMQASRLSHYMVGRNYPDPPIFALLCKALGVSSDWVLGLTETELPVADLEEKLATATGEGKINKVMRGMSKGKQQQVLQFAEYLLSQETKTQKEPPIISPLPLSERQRNLMAIKIILDSVQQKYGIDARRDMERSIRDQLDGTDPAE